MGAFLGKRVVAPDTIVPLGSSSPAPQTTECVLEPNLKVGSTHWCHQSRIVNYHRTIKRCAWHFPCFVRFHSLKTIINHFQLRYPAFGAKRTPNGVLFCCLRMLGVSPPTAGSCFAATQVVWSIICATSSKLLDTLPTLLRKFRSKRYSIVLNSFPSIRSQHKCWTFTMKTVSTVSALKNELSEGRQINDTRKLVFVSGIYAWELSSESES